MNERVRILLVEDLPTDAELAQREIKQVLSKCDFLRVETREDYLAAIETFQPDLIVSDYNMPRFDGLTALRLALAQAPFTPVIILTGAINEDTAVECMKAGAIDYVIKEHIKRLGQAVLHALEEKQLRQEQRKAEEALRQSEERYRTLAEAANDLIFISDKDNILQYINKFGAQLIGRQQEDVVGRKYSELFSPSSADQQNPNLQTVFETGQSSYDEHPIPTPNGEVWLGTSLVPIRGESGKINTVLGIARDVTKRIQMEQALRLTQFSIDRASIGIMRTGENARILSVNDQICANMGYSCEELCNMNVYDIDPNFPLERWKQHRQTLRVNGTDTFETTHRRKDGSTFPVEITANYLEFQGQEYSFSFVRDITERKQAEEAQTQLEEQLRQAQKLEGIGRLAGGIAHDFNNLLVPIIGYAELGQMELSPDSGLHADLEKIKTAAERAASLTRQILAFSRQTVLEIQVLNLNEIVGQFQEMLGRLIGEDIELQILLTPTPCLIRADRTQIEQLLLNLCVNARDAMPNGGKLIAETDDVFLDEIYAQKYLETKPGAYVMLSLSDTGIGMDKETREHIFEPFFTTKEPGKGTGLGLATVFGIVKQHQGNIWVYSEPGQGTTFKIYLPKLEGTQSVAPAISEPESMYGTETILVVEDEPMVRKLASETLEAYGYTVMEAGSPNDGLKFVSTYKGVVHLVLTDVIMPGMNGRELFEQMVIIRPDLKALYMSGYTDDIIVHHGVLDKGVSFLQKPFTVHGLTQKVRRVLDTQ